MRHPDRVLRRDALEQGGAAPRDGQRGAAVLARAGVVDGAAERLGHQLEAVAHAEDRHAGLEDRAVELRRALFVDRRGAAGEDDRLGVLGEHLGDRHAARHDLAVDPGLTHPTGDELGVLGTEVDDQDGVGLGCGLVGNSRGHRRPSGSGTKGVARSAPPEGDGGRRAGVWGRVYRAGRFHSSARPGDRDRAGRRFVASDDRTTAPHPPGAPPPPRPGAPPYGLAGPRVELIPVHRRAWRRRGPGSAGSGAPWDRARVQRPASRGQRPRPRLDQGGGAAGPGDARDRPPHPGATQAHTLHRPAPLRASPCAPADFTTHRDHRTRPPGRPGRPSGGSGDTAADRPGRKWTVPNHAESVAEQALRPARCCLEEVLPLAEGHRWRFVPVPPRPRWQRLSPHAP